MWSALMTSSCRGRSWRAKVFVQFYPQGNKSDDMGCGLKAGKKLPACHKKLFGIAYLTHQSNLTREIPYNTCTDSSHMHLISVGRSDSKAIKIVPAKYNTYNSDCRAASKERENVDAALSGDTPLPDTCAAQFSYPASSCLRLPHITSLLGLMRVSI